MTYSKSGKRERRYSKSGKRERRRYSKSSKRERGIIQNPARERELSYSKSGNSWKARKYYKVAGIASVGSAKVAGLLLLCEGQDGPCINDNEP